MAKRTGATTLQKTARQMCKFVVAFSPAIRGAFPESAALHLALESALTACSVLENELTAVIEVGD